MNKTYNSTTITRDGFLTDGASETCFTVSNGHFAVRGTTDELYDCETPGTYVAGIFDKKTAAVTELVNLPYPFGMRLYINREPFDLRDCQIHSYTRELDMKTGVYSRRFRATDKTGRTLGFSAERFASVADRSLGCAIYKITCESFTGVLNIESFIECDVFNSKNNPNERIRHFTSKTGKTVKTDNGEPNGENCLFVKCDTDSYTVGIASSSRISGISDAVQINEYYRNFGCYTAQYIELDIEHEGATVEVERFVALNSSREVPAETVEDCVLANLTDAARLGSESLLKAHTEAMSVLWEDADVSIEGDPEIDHALRFCLYTLICCVDPADKNVSIGARGLHGEGYKGHVFWDTEVFMLPFFIYALPGYARTLLYYRYNTLKGAKENAELGGYTGARYAWESADTGLEETPRWGFDYKGNRVPIKTGDLELHITGDIAYALHEYVRASGDRQFLMEQAAPIILETARFWISRLEYNKTTDRYEINNVIGPDEFHEHVNNSAYTNSLARWNLQYAAECAETLCSSESAAVVTPACHLPDSAEILKWRETAEKIHIPASGGIIEQFDGYFALKDRIVTEFDANQMPVWPGDVDIANLNDYTLVKQADVIMLMHLLDEQFGLDVKRENFIYYDQRTMHKSSLGPSMYALMGARTGQHAKAYTNFYRTVMTDISDNQGNTAQGIHAASAGGAWCALFYGFCGVSFDGSQLHVDPWLPEKWQSVKLNFHYQGRKLRLTVNGQGASLERLSGPEGLKAIVNGRVIEI